MAINDMTDKLLISVVIATYNRCDTLKTTLKKLEEQTIGTDKFEVIVVNDGSSDNTSQMVESLTETLSYRLSYLSHENHGPGYTENRGIKKAECDVVLLIADDIWPTPDMLEEHIKSHNEHPEENIAILGNVTQSPDLPPTVMHKYWDPFRYDRFKGKKELDPINFLACHISVKKNFLVTNGMFRERKGAAHEDIELGYRLKQKGLRLIYNENALAYHYHTDNMDKACKRAYERGVNLDLLSENIPKSYVYHLYRIFTLEAGLAACIKMLPREAIRWLIFNRLTVSCFWRPVLEKAEDCDFAKLFANSATYRGTIYYHMRKGFYQTRRLKRAERTI